MANQNKYSGPIMDTDIVDAARALQGMSRTDVDTLLEEMDDARSDTTLPLPSPIEDDYVLDETTGIPMRTFLTGDRTATPGFRDMPHSPLRSDSTSLGFFRPDFIDDSELAVEDKHEILSFFWGNIVAPKGFRARFTREFNAFEALMITLADNYEGDVPFTQSPGVKTLLMSIRNPNARNGSVYDFAEHLDEAYNFAEELNEEYLALKSQDGSAPIRSSTLTMPPLRR